MKKNLSIKDDGGTKFPGSVCPETPLDVKPEYYLCHIELKDMVIDGVPYELSLIIKQKETSP